MIAAPDAEARERAGLSGLARSGAVSLAGAAISAITSMLVVLVVTRALPKQTAGIFFALTSVFLIAEMIARLGTGTGLVYAISRARALGAPERASAFLRVALTPVVALSVLIAGVLLLNADSFAGLLTERTSGVVTTIRVLALLLPLTTVSDTLISATRGYATIVPTVVLDRVSRPVIQLVAVFLVVTTGSLVALTTAWAAPWIVCAILAACWLARLQRPTETARSSAAHSAQPAPWREFWSFTAPRAAASVVQLALQRLDIVLLILLAGPVQAALYTAATRFLVVGQFANQALTTVVEPRLNRLLALTDRPAANAVYQAATGWLVLLTWPMYLLVTFYANQFLDLFGRGYDAGSTVVLVLALTMLGATAVGMVDVVLIMGGRTGWNLFNSALGLSINVGVDLFLIPRLGLLGAAIGWAAAILANNLIPLAQVWRTMGLHPFGRGTGTAAALSAFCFAVLPWAAREVFGEGIVPLTATTGLGLLLFVAGAWRWRSGLALDTLRALRRARGKTADVQFDDADLGGA